MQPKTSMKTPTVQIWTVLIPTSLITLAACGIIPWLIETRDRLDNEYWEAQLLFAIIALSAVCTALPGIILRAVGRLERISSLVWALPIAAYTLVLVFIVQSHFPLVSKVIVTLVSLLLISVSFTALRIERHKTTASEQVSVGNL